MAFKIKCIPWEDILLELIPEIIVRNSLTNSSINAKTLYQKTKDLKLSDLGLQSQHIEDYLTRNFHTESVAVKKQPSSGWFSSFFSDSKSPNDLSNSGSYHSISPSHNVEPLLSSSPTETPKMEKPETPPSSNHTNSTISPESTRNKPRSTSSPTQFIRADSSEVKRAVLSVQKLRSQEIPEEDNQIDLREVMEDSPMFRMKLKVAENDVIEFASQLQKLLKISKEYCDCALDIGQKRSKFAGLFPKLASSLHETRSKERERIENGLNQFSSLIRDSLALEELLVSEVQSAVIDPLQELLEVDIKELRSQSKRYEDLTSEYTTVQAKLTTKKESEKGQLELSTCKAKMQATGIDFVYRLNTIQRKKRWQFLTSICDYMAFNHMYSEKIYHLYKDLEPFIKDFNMKLRHERREMDENTEKNNEKRQSVREIIRDKVTTKQGYLFKRTTSSVDKKKKYFVISDGSLTETMDLEMISSIPLLTCTARFRGDIDKRCFEVVSPSESLILQADDESECKDWVNVLQNVIADELNSQNHSSSNSTANTALINSNNNSHNLPKYSPIKLLQQIDITNNFCADCDTEYPEWASINLGILTCIECSGVHRRLGVHISKVRSLHLDKWDNELLEYMKAVGNSKANSIFENNIFSPWKKPMGNCDRTAREKWIRAKYEQKLFLSPEKIADPERELFEASKRGDLLKVLELVVRGVGCDFPLDEEKKTALHAAIEQGHFLCAMLLVQNGANLKCIDRKGRSILHFAAEKGDKEIVSFLLKNLENKELLDWEDLQGKTPIDYLLGSQNTELLQIFMDFSGQTAKTETQTVVVDSQ